MTCLPYVHGLSEKLKSILSTASIKVAFKPISTLSSKFQVPKARPTEEKTKAIVYRYKCGSCPFTYIGESKRSWATRWLEHKPGVRKKNFSAIKEHTEITGHDAVKTKDILSHKLY